MEIAHRKPPFFSNWGFLLLRGVVALVLGAFAFLMAAPGARLSALAFAWGAYAVVDGALSLVFAARARSLEVPAWAPLLLGLVGITSGLFAVIRPATMAISLMVLVGSWALLVGLAEIATWARMRDHVSNEWYLGIAGVLAVLYGSLVLVSPVVLDTTTVAFSLGWFALFTGALLVLAALRVRTLEGRLPFSRPEEVPFGNHSHHGRTSPAIS